MQQDLYSIRQAIQQALKGKKIGFKPRYRSSKIASTRLRSTLPCNLLRQAGYSCEIFRGNLFRPKQLKDYGLVVFQKAYRPEDIQLAEALRAEGIPMILDVCDNHLYLPQASDQPLPDSLLLEDRAKQLRQMLGLVDWLTVSTDALAETIQADAAANQGNLHGISVIEDVLEYPRLWPGGMAFWIGWQYRKQIFSPQQGLRLLWFGNAGSSTPPSGLTDLGRIIPELNTLHQELSVCLTVLSNSPERFESEIISRHPTFPVQYLPWQRHAFAYLLKAHDVCLLPISLNPFTQCKTNNRLVLSLILGVPVVADCIASYASLSDCFLSGNWVESLRAYAHNPGLAQAHVQAAQQKIRAHYTPNLVVSQWSGVFAQVLSLR